MSALKSVVSRIDWGQLRTQKAWLIRQEDECAEGLLNLIDAIQDAAIDDAIVTEGEVFLDWSSAWNPIAEREGWGLFNEGVIQRDDEANEFKSDDEAIDFVRRMAAAGSVLHQLAIASHDRNQKEAT